MSIDTLLGISHNRTELNIKECQDCGVSGCAHDNLAASLMGYNCPSFGIGFEPPQGSLITPQPSFATQDLTIVPYQRNMPLDGDVTLSGSSGTAVINLGDNISIHHHDHGGGMLYAGGDRVQQLPFSIQTRLPSFDPDYSPSKEFIKTTDYMKELK